MCQGLFDFLKKILLPDFTHKFIFRFA